MSLDGGRAELVTPAQAAERLATTPRKISELAARARITPVRTVSGEWRYRLDDLRRALERETQNAAPEPAQTAEPASTPPAGRSRSRARRRALEVLHAADVAGTDARAALTDDDDPLTRALVSGVLEHREEIDRMIGERAEHWTMDRMPVVDRNLLRLGTYELLHTDVPAGVAVNEAVSLAKMLSTEGSHRFVNGLLGRIARDARGR